MENNDYLEAVKVHLEDVKTFITTKINFEGAVFNINAFNYCRPTKYNVDILLRAVTKDSFNGNFTRNRRPQIPGEIPDLLELFDFPTARHYMDTVRNKTDTLSELYRNKQNELIEVFNCRLKKLREKIVFAFYISECQKISNEIDEAVVAYREGMEKLKNKFDAEWEALEKELNNYQV